MSKTEPSTDLRPCETIIDPSVLFDVNGTPITLDEYLDRQPENNKIIPYYNGNSLSVIPKLGLSPDELISFVGGLVPIASTLEEIYKDDTENSWA